MSNKIFNSIFNTIDAKYKIFKRFTTVSCTVVINRYFILDPALESKIYYRILCFNWFIIRKNHLKSYAQTDLGVNQFVSLFKASINFESSKMSLLRSKTCF